MKHRVRSFSPDTGKGEWDELFPRALLELRVVVASQLPTRKLFCYLCTRCFARFKSAHAGVKLT
jgi:hypothetical protein